MLQQLRHIVVPVWHAGNRSLRTIRVVQNQIDVRSESRRPLSRFGHEGQGDRPQATAAFRPHTTQSEDPAPPILGGLHHECGLESSTFVRLTLEC